LASQDDPSPTIANLLQVIDDVARYETGKLSAGEQLLAPDAASGVEP
jgi:hypothetical protein